MTKKIHFMHIPKTGGTSLFKFLDQQFKQKDVCPFIYLYSGPPWLDEKLILKDLADEQLSKYHFFKGHLGWVPRTIVSEDEIESIAFLRDPIDRTISLYNYYRWDTILYHDFPKRWSCFEDFIDDESRFGYRSMNSNMQTKQFCLDLLPKEKFTWPMHQDLSGNEEQLLKIAIERIHRCEFVGLTEHFNESFEALCMQYHWFIPPRVPKTNVSDKFATRSSLSAKTLERVMELNQLDSVLYQEAVKIYAERKKTRVYLNCEEFEKNIISNIEARDEIQFTFDDKILGTGWDEREGKIPNVFCWSNATRSTLIFFIKSQGDLSLSFTVLHSTLSNHLETLTVAANEHPITLAVQEHPDGGIIFSGVIPSHVLCNESTRLELSFSIPEIKHPNEKDLRKLGFACSKVEIKPISDALHHSSPRHLQESLKTFAKKLRGVLVG